MSTVGIIVVTVMIFVCALSILIVYSATGEIADVISTDTDIDPRYMEGVERGIASYNYGFLFLVVIGLLGVSVASSMFIPTHPIFIPISLIVLVFAVGIGALLSNSYVEIASAQSLASAGNELNIILLIMQNLPQWIAVIGGAGFIIGLYLKSRGATL